MSPHAFLQTRLQAAVANVIPGVDVGAVLVRPCPDPKFGDYQSNALIAVAKQRQMNPRQLAADVVAQLDVSALCEPVEIAGAGFLNFRLTASAIATAVQSARGQDEFFFTRAARTRTYVVDFSSPNVAKPMHVGHIRSTGIGDTLVRTLRLLGHTVITDNHIGDWGTQFGMLLLAWKTRLNHEALEADALGELDRLYQEINALCDPDKPTFQPEIRDAAKAELVRLQAGDAENLGVWREMLRLSQQQFDAIYRRLGVQFQNALGESFYNPWLAEIVTDLVEKQIARPSEDAIAAFSSTVFVDPAKRPAPKEDPFLVNRDGEWVDDPALIQKSDGGFNYMTTDLATVRYRVQQWQPDEIVYVVDDRQTGHFKKLFAIVRRWLPHVATRLTHVGFGKICGPDKKPLKTRDGNTPKLTALLDEAEERALATVTTLRPELPDAERRAIARVVGLGALKYQDLLPNRESDYVFNWEKMLSLSGNTAPYLQYAYTRIRSIIRKGEAEGVTVGSVESVEFAAPEELHLARHLLNFGLVLEAVVEDYRPNYLCNYLFDLAGRYSRFYEACPVLKSEGKTRLSRLILCEATGRVLRQGLEVLGIETLEQM